MKKLLGAFGLLLMLSACAGDYEDDYEYDDDDSYEDAENWLEEEIRQEDLYGDDISDEMNNF